MRAVVQILLYELLERTPAQPEILDRVGQIARRRRERQNGADDLQLFAAFTVDVAHAGLRFAEDLAVRPGSQAILLTLRHRRGQ